MIGLVVLSIKRGYFEGFDTQGTSRLPGTVNWGTATVIGVFAGMLYGGSKEAAASASKDAEVMLKLGSTPSKREQIQSANSVSHEKGEVKSGVKAAIVHHHYEDDDQELSIVGEQPRRVENNLSQPSLSFFLTTRNHHQGSRRSCCDHLRWSPFIPITIDLSHNKLVGKVLDSIGNLHTLQKLDLSYNNLTGAIPTSFEELSNVYWLDLSHNSLSGEIPQQLTQLSLLNHFDISYNQLTGPIPQGGQLTTFENDSFVGNPGLCGSPLSNKCGNHEVLAPPHDSSVEEDEGSADVIGWVIRCMGYISGLVVGLVLGRMITDENHDWFVETFGRRQQYKKKKKTQRNTR
ncbi:hypothetical protein Droror1_Dr00021307 [Drosera rotundifolia]